MVNVSESLGWDIGAYSHKAVLEEVELGGTNVTYAAGDIVTFTGINAAGQMVATKPTGTEAVHGVIAKGQNGTSGEIKAVVCSGDVVAKVGGAFTAGMAIHTKGGKLVNSGASTPSANTYGFVRGTTTADGDYVLICLKPN